MHEGSRRVLLGGGDPEAVLGGVGGRRRELPGSKSSVKQVLRQCQWLGGGGEWGGEVGRNKVRPGYAGFDCFDKECEF